MLWWKWTCISSFTTFIHINVRINMSTMIIISINPELWMMMYEDAHIDPFPPIHPQFTLNCLIWSNKIVILWWCHDWNEWDVETVTRNDHLLMNEIFSHWSFHLIGQIQIQIDCSQHHAYLHSSPFSSSHSSSSLPPLPPFFFNNNMIECNHVSQSIPPPHSILHDNHQVHSWQIWPFLSWTSDPV